MPDYEQELEKRTLKGQCESTEPRVYYVLADSKMGPVTVATPRELEMRLHRTMKVLAGLLEHLEKKNLLAEADIDQLLWNAVQ